MLCHGHERPDGKLTPSERTRITDAFYTAWRIILDTAAGNQAVAAGRFAQLSHEEELFLRDITLFMVDNVDVGQHVIIGDLMGYAGDGDGGEIRIEQKLLELLEVITGNFEAQGMTG